MPRFILVVSLGVTAMVGCKPRQDLSGAKDVLQYSSDKTTAGKLYWTAEAQGQSYVCRSDCAAGLPAKVPSGGNAAAWEAQIKQGCYQVATLKAAPRSKFPATLAAVLDAMAAGKVMNIPAARTDWTSALDSVLNAPASKAKPSSGLEDPAASSGAAPAAAQICQRGDDAAGVAVLENPQESAPAGPFRYAQCEMPISCSFNTNRDGSIDIGSRPLRAYALDLEAKDDADLLLIAQSRLRAAALETKKIGPVALESAPDEYGRKVKRGTGQCDPDLTNLPQCSVKTDSTRYEVYDLMLHVQHVASSVFVAKVPYSNETDYTDYSDVDPFVAADKYLIQDAAQINFPLPETMYCYFVVDKTRQFIQADANGTNWSTMSSYAAFAQQRGWFSTRTTGGNEATSSSGSSFHLTVNTSYQKSSSIILEESAPKGAYTDPTTMKQDLCNKAQERYLKGNTVNDVLSGCYCAGERILPNSKVNNIGVFEF